MTEAERIAVQLRELRDLAERRTSRGTGLDVGETRLLVIEFEDLARRVEGLA